jgi:hypothetical protein
MAYNNNTQEETYLNEHDKTTETINQTPSFHPSFDFDKEV